MGQRLDVFNQFQLHYRARQFIVGHGWMAKISGQQYFIITITFNYQITIRETSIFQCAVYHHMIFFIIQGLFLILTYTEAPPFFIVGRHIRNPVGLVGLGIQMTEQLFP